MISHEELKQDLLVSFMTNTPAMVYGAIGIGKSHTIREAAKEYAKMKDLKYKEWNSLDNKSKQEIADGKYDLSKAMILIDIRASTMDPSDIKGLPNLSGEYIRWLPDIIFKTASRKDFNGVLFFDEVNQAIGAVQSTLYQVFLDNVAGNTKLSDNCFRVAAGNRTKDKSNVNKLSMALQCRMTNTELALPNSKSWINNFAMPNKLNKTIVSYIGYSPDSLYENPNSKSKRYNFANPRNWERLSKQLDCLDKLYPNKNDKYFAHAERIAEWNIGAGSAKFMAYLSLHKEIDIKAIIKDPKSIKKLPLDQQWFASDMIVSEYGKRGKKFIDVVIEILFSLDKDLARLMCDKCAQENNQFWSQMDNDERASKWFTDVIKFVNS